MRKNREGWRSGGPFGFLELLVYSRDTHLLDDDDDDDDDADISGPKNIIMCRRWLVIQNPHSDHHVIVHRVTPHRM